MLRPQSAEMEAAAVKIQARERGRQHRAAQRPQPEAYGSAGTDGLEAGAGLMEASHDSYGDGGTQAPSIGAWRQLGEILLTRAASLLRL